MARHQPKNQKPDACFPLTMLAIMISADPVGQLAQLIHHRLHPTFSDGLHLAGHRIAMLSDEVTSLVGKGLHHSDSSIGHHGQLMLADGYMLHGHHYEPEKHHHHHEAKHVAVQDEGDSYGVYLTPPYPAVPVTAGFQTGPLAFQFNHGLPPGVFGPPTEVPPPVIVIPPITPPPTNVIPVTPPTIDLTVTKEDQVFNNNKCGCYGSMGMGFTLVPNQPLLSGFSSNSNTAHVGSDILYKITISNSGPDEGFNLNVLDTLPAGLKGIAWEVVSETGGATSTIALGSLNNTGNTLNDIVNLPKGASITFYFEAEVTKMGTNKCGCSNEITNTVNVNVPSGTVNTGQSSASDTDTIKNKNKCHEKPAPCHTAPPCGEKTCNDKNDKGCKPEKCEKPAPVVCHPVTVPCEKHEKDCKKDDDKCKDKPAPVVCHPVTVPCEKHEKDCKKDDDKCKEKPAPVVCHPVAVPCEKHEKDCKKDGDKCKDKPAPVVCHPVAVPCEKHEKDCKKDDNKCKDKPAPVVCHPVTVPCEKHEKDCKKDDNKCKDKPAPVVCHPVAVPCEKHEKDCKKDDNRCKDKPAPVVCHPVTVPCEKHEKDCKKDDNRCKDKPAPVVCHPVAVPCEKHEKDCKKDGDKCKDKPAPVVCHPVTVPCEKHEKDCKKDDNRSKDTPAPVVCHPVTTVSCEKHEKDCKKDDKRDCKEKVFTPVCHEVTPPKCDTHEKVCKPVQCEKPVTANLIAPPKCDNHEKVCKKEDDKCKEKHAPVVCHPAVVSCEKHDKDCKKDGSKDCKEKVFTPVCHEVTPPKCDTHEKVCKPVQCEKPVTANLIAPPKCDNHEKVCKKEDDKCKKFEKTFVAPCHDVQKGHEFCKDKHDDKCKKVEKTFTAPCHDVPKNHEFCKGKEDRKDHCERTAHCDFSMAAGLAFKYDKGHEFNNKNDHRPESKPCDMNHDKNHEADCGKFEKHKEHRQDDCRDEKHHVDHHKAGDCMPGQTYQFSLDKGIHCMKDFDKHGHEHHKGHPEHPVACVSKPELHSNGTHHQVCENLDKYFEKHDCHQKADNSNCHGTHVPGNEYAGLHAPLGLGIAQGCMEMLFHHHHVHHG